ncbi:MAG: amino acid ABC transporter ATP-binding protein [Anaerovoracaceae bacterium]|nr:amino acid ABC transporter ATP-binding protein [Anaerovoracaceae bacterium]
MPILEVNNLHKTFGKVEVLKGVDLSLEKGEVMAIIGSSGGGKTTLLRCINYLELAEKGTIKVKGETIYDGEKKITEEEIRKNRLHFGMVFQQFNLFPQYTVKENITLAPKLLKKHPDNEISDIADELIAKVGLTEKTDNYPWQLSGGQQQRVAIARAMAMEPDILCFDEPTSALDPELTGEVLRVIKSLKSKDNTMIVVTHEMGFAKEVADKVVFIDAGKIVACGSPKEIFDNPDNERLRAFLSAMLKA